MYLKIVYMYLLIKIKFVDITIFGRYMIKIDRHKIKFDWYMTKIGRHRTKFDQQRTKVDRKTLYFFCQIINVLIFLLEIDIV